MILTREKKEIWNSFEKVSFRFLFLYFTLYILSLFTASIWNPIIQWLGTYIFDINYEFSSNGRGSGDTTYAYLLLFLFFFLSIIGAIIWSLIDRKRKSYNQLQYGFLVGVRFILIFFMFTYGFVKVFHLQMPELSNANLIKTLGEKSPMGLAWTFMGFSKTYSIFAGLAEVIAGILLIPRRTQTLGAIAVIVVMLNVFMMNLCFDIPVKIFSFHLMLMGVLLLMADFKRVFGVLVQNNNIGEYIIYPQLKKGDRKIILIVKVVLFLLISGLFVFTNYPRYKKFYVNAKPPLYGIWEVEKFEKNTVEVPANLNEEKRWRYIAIDHPRVASIKTMDDKQNFYKFRVDTLKNVIAFSKRYEKTADTLNFKKVNNKLIITGIIKKDSIKIQLKPKNVDDFLLKSRGFNWINERPLNR
ncbi:hypothetical protein [Tenacibaculum holothuriorum]|uniref:hypothetical protein n=1 Tax=Tenacibaculum holothuriorum TaxID=1635173 RepID=UPI000A3247D2|nr:hypothetical protein [Tenacibaculum holothuriorum]